MAEDAEVLRAFRDRVRLSVIENLTLKTALAMPVLARALSSKESREVLKGWLDENSAVADHAYGAHFQDPALTALYADEAKSVIEKMKKTVDKMARDFDKLQRQIRS